MNVVVLLLSLVAGRVEEGLGSPRFAERERASRVLQKFWVALSPWVYRMSESPDPEVRARVAQALGRGWRPYQFLGTFDGKVALAALSGRGHRDVTVRLVLARPVAREMLAALIDCYRIRGKTERRDYCWRDGGYRGTGEYEPEEFGFETWDRYAVKPSGWTEVGIFQYLGPYYGFLTEIDTLRERFAVVMEVGEWKSTP